MTREEAIKVLESMKSEESHNALIDLCNIAIEAINNEQNMHKGKWLIRDDMPKLDNTYSIECSECGQLMFGHYNADNPNYCCNCGAKMKGGDTE